VELNLFRARRMFSNLPIFLLPGRRLFVAKVYDEEEMAGTILFINAAQTQRHTLHFLLDSGAGRLLLLILLV
jgi:hypothetical protein